MIYHFDVCTYDTNLGGVRRREELVHVEPQALRVLRYLIEHRERVVSRDELIEEC